MIKPTFHHVNLKTTRLQEMIDWYGVVVGATVNLQSDNIAFISNDRTHHRIALLAVPGLRDDPEKFVHTGIHHTAFEYDSFDDLLSSFARLKQTGIEPDHCLNHGVATFLYYSDPGCSTAIRSMIGAFRPDDPSSTMNQARGCV